MPYIAYDVTLSFVVTNIELPLVATSPTSFDTKEVFDGIIPAPLSLLAFDAVKTDLYPALYLDSASVAICFT